MFTVGTKSVLFGVHQFLIHPMLLFISWWKLFGFPWDLRLWVAFVVHDLGYIGKPNMDGPEGELHPYFGAAFMGFLFDYPYCWFKSDDELQKGYWYQFTLLHSRYLAKKLNKQPSKLAIADKLVIAIEPSWLYLPRATATGEINDYFEQAVKCEPNKGGDFGIEGIYEALTNIKQGGITRDPWLWHKGVKAYMRIWVEQHKDGKHDTMTSEQRGN